MLLAAHHTSQVPEYKRTSKKRKGIVDENRCILPEYQSFFMQLPYFYELSKRK